MEKIRLQENFYKTVSQFKDWESRKYITPVYYSQYYVTIPLIRKYVKDKFLDLGCGEMPYRSIIEPKVNVYDTLDFFPKIDKVTYQCDIQNMDIIPAESYDSAICIEVLEHIQDPGQAINEIYRILKPGATLVATVPFLGRLHDIPHDYYRYTRFGLTFLFQRAGFEIETLVERGGLMSFLGHQISWIILGLFGTIPVLHNIVLFINRYLVTILSWKLDRWLQTDSLFPLGYAIVLRKP